MLVVALVLICSCDKEKVGLEPTPEPPVSTTREFKNLKEIFGFYGQSRYSYCPSLVKEENGTVHVYFCGNPEELNMVDNIYHIRINPDGTQTPAKSVLQPGISGSWDDHHTCDPSVIGGKFSMNGINYKYALFFLSNPWSAYYNEIGVAFSNDLEADSWVKYPTQVVKKTWDYDGDELLGGGGKSWGVGQPSAFSIDKEGKVLLTYTIGDKSGTRIAWAQLDLSNMDNYQPVYPTRMIEAGLTNLNYTGNDVLNNADFAVDNENNIIVMVRNVHPNPSNYPAYIEECQEIDYMPYDDFLKSKGTWKALFRITPTITTFPRNHNSGIERNKYGEIENWEEPVIYYTVSQAAPNVEPSGRKHAEWTYHIWRGQYTSK
jgi:hypothetical protein